MIDDINRKIWKLLGREDVRLHADVSLQELRRRSSGHVYPFIPPQLILEADEPIDYGILNQARELIESYRNVLQESEALKQQNRVLDREVQQILNMEEDLLVDEVYLGKLFAFLGEDTHCCILRDGEPLSCVGLTSQTVDYCLRRLQHQPHFSVPVDQGELYAVAVDDYQALFECDRPFSEFAKRIISLKLNWLGSKHREKLFIRRLKFMEERYLDGRKQHPAAHSEYDGITPLELRKEYHKLDEELRGLMKQAITDSLTNVYNRSKINQLLQQAIGEAERHHVTFTVIMFDIDHFKAINDTHGHLVGDRILIGIADRTREALRATDVLARWGGEEFLILLPDTDREQGAAVAEKLRTRIQEQPFENDIGVTCSYGLAEYSGETSGEALLARADGALYAAKHQGRDAVVVADASV